MIRIILLIITAMGFFFGAILAWCSGYRVLACLLLVATLVTAYFFEPHDGKGSMDDEYLEK